MIRSSRKSYGNVFVQMPSRPTNRSKAGSASSPSSTLLTIEASSSDESSASVSSAMLDAASKWWFIMGDAVLGLALVVLLLCAWVTTSNSRPSSSCGRMNRRDDNRNENMYSCGATDGQTWGGRVRAALWWRWIARWFGGGVVFCLLLVDFVVTREREYKKE